MEEHKGSPKVESGDGPAITPPELWSSCSLEGCSRCDNCCSGVIATKTQIPHHLAATTTMLPAAFTTPSPFLLTQASGFRARDFLVFLPERFYFLCLNELPALIELSFFWPSRDFLFVSCPFTLQEETAAIYSVPSLDDIFVTKCHRRGIKKKQGQEIKEISIGNTSHRILEARHSDGFLGVQKPRIPLMFSSVKKT